MSRARFFEIQTSPHSGKRLVCHFQKWESGTHALNFQKTGISGVFWRFRKTMIGPSQALEAHLFGEALERISLAWWFPLPRQNPVPSALCSRCHSWPAPGLWRNTWLARAQFSLGQEVVALDTPSLVKQWKNSRWGNKEKYGTRREGGGEDTRLGVRGLDLINLKKTYWNLSRSLDLSFLICKMRCLASDLIKTQDWIAY